MYTNIIVKQIYWFISQISDERLQNHWTSGFSHVGTKLLTSIMELMCVAKWHKDSAQVGLKPRLSQLGV